MIGYAIGREFGYWLLLRYGNYVRMTESRIKLGQYLFLRHGGKIVFVAQFVPVLRTFAGIFAGANVMPWRDFLVANGSRRGDLGGELRLCRLCAGPAIRTAWKVLS